MIYIYIYNIICTYHVFIYCILHKNNRFIIQYFQLHTHNGERERTARSSVDTWLF